MLDRSRIGSRINFEFNHQKTHRIGIGRMSELQAKPERAKAQIISWQIWRLHAETAGIQGLQRIQLVRMLVRSMFIGV
jgi:hypothetical protein